MTTVLQNVIANAVGRAWGALSVYLFLPLYVKLLGIEAFGLVGFYSTLTAVLALADLGLTGALSREMARLSIGRDTAEEMKSLVRTYERIYFAIAFAIGLIIWLLAPFIAERWLSAKVLPTADIASSVRLMGIAISFQMPAGLYVGALGGLQDQVATNVLQGGWGLLRGVASVAVLGWLSPTIVAFAVCQLAANALYCVASRKRLLRVLPRGGGEARFERSLLERTWRYAAGVTMMALGSTCLSQADKLAVSKLLPLGSLGLYVLAGALGSIPMILATPVAAAVLPRLTGRVALGDRESVAALYHEASSIVSCIFIPATVALALTGGRVLAAWTGVAAAAQDLGAVTSLLVVAQGCQALTLMPFYLALANGETGLVVKMQVVSLGILVPLLVLAVPRWGLLGAAGAWCAMNVAVVPPYMFLLHRRYLPGHFHEWLLVDVLRPLVLAIPVVFLGVWVAPKTLGRAALGVTLAVVISTAMLVAVAGTPAGRRLLSRSKGALRSARLGDRGSR